MKRNFCIIFLIFSILKVNAQQTASYPTELVKLDSSKIHLVKQCCGITLGDWFPNVRICNVCYHIQAQKYFVFGFVDDLNYANLDSLSIDVMDGDGVVYSTHTSKNGVFSFALAKGETARIKGGLYVDVIIDEGAGMPSILR